MISFKSIFAKIHVNCQIYILIDIPWVKNIIILKEKFWFSHCSSLNMASQPSKSDGFLGFSNILTGFMRTKKMQRSVVRLSLSQLQGLEKKEAALDMKLTKNNYCFYDQSSLHGRKSPKFLAYLTVHYEENNRSLLQELKTLVTSLKRNFVKW